MDCLSKEKKNRKIIIWTLDGSPKFYQVEFKEIQLSSNYNLKIVWNRPIKNVTTNAITIKFSHSDVFFEEKTVSTNQFLLQSDEIINDIYSDINNKLLLHGLTVESESPKLKIKKYVNKIIKHINKRTKENIIKSTP